MKVPVKKLKKSFAKRIREGAGEGQMGPTPKRPTVSRPELLAPPEPAGALEVDLTADTPPEVEAVEKTVPRPVTEEPAVEEEPVLHETPPTEARNWDEGPSGATNSPPEQVPSGSLPRASHATTGVTEGGEVREIPPRGSDRSDARWAERLVAPIVLPDIQEELSHLSTVNFFKESYAAAIKVINSLAATREVIHGGKSLMREAQKEAEEARARAEAAEKALASVKCQVEVEANRASAALTQLTAMENAVMARDLHISELSAVSHATEQRLREVEKRAGELEERVVAAEGRSQEIERAAAASLTAERARVTELENEMEARVSKAIEEYKASRSFMEEITEASTDAYIQGFREGKEKVARDLNFPQALEVEPERLSEISSSDDESAPAQP